MLKLINLINLMVEIKDQIHLRFTKDFSLNMSSDKNLKDYFF